MKDDGMMTRERFSALLDAYGGDLRRWPEPSRSGAEVLLARDAAARRQRDQALALDALLDEAPSPLPSRALKHRIAERARPSVWRQSLVALWPFGPAWQPAAALALIAALGIALGPYISFGESANAGSVTNEIDILGIGASLDSGDQP